MKTSTKIMRYFGAAALTIILLIIARQLSMVRPVNLKTSGGGVVVEHTTVPKIVEGKPDRITVKIINPDQKVLAPVLRWILAKENIEDLNRYQSLAMIPDSTPDTYAAIMPAMERGKIIYYYIDVRDDHGMPLARLPESGERPIKLKYEGGVPFYIVIPHIFLMFIAIFLAALALFDAIGVLSGHARLLPMARNFLWATLAVFFGGYPFGWAMNYFAFGTIWEGIPFGWDFTDNKTQIVLLYLVFLNLSTLGTLSKNRLGSDNFRSRPLAWLGLLGFVLVMAIYIVPHSIQFSIPVTALFSYGLTAAIVILYIWGLTGKKKWNASSSPK
jgi:hypothetical protein